jgi:1,4-dihydroxy-2-naphthoyl-CoA hydrolase
VETTAFDGLLDRLKDGEVVHASELRVLDGDRFASQELGIRLEDLSLERITATLDTGPRHHQPYGIVHGGVWCSVIETLASVGAALHAAADGRAVVGVSNSTDFLRAHREGTVHATATPVHVGRSQHLWQVVIVRASDGKPVARGQVRLQVIDPSQVA